MLLRGTSRTGQPILFSDGKPLHSTYDPVREARRFAQAALAGAAAVPTIVLVGAAMGYLEEAILAEAPQARLLRVALSPDVAGIRGGAAQDTWWQPGSLTLPAFLARWLDESDLAGLRVVEWAPAAAAWPEEASSAHAAIRQFVERLKASYATTAAFGPLWLRNAIANFVGLQAVGPLPPARAGDVLCIAASGPTLEEALPSLRQHRQRMRLWALPSSVRPLAHAGLRPDLIVLTDPGLYALQHIPAAYGVPIAMPLSAARGSWRFTDTVLLFAQPYGFEKELAALLAPWPMPIIPPQGTVAASALQLAAAVGHRTIVFAGLDFCYRDILSHARPSLFDLYHGSRAGRLAPFEGALYGQAVEAEAGSAGFRTTVGLRAYAQWFATVAPAAGVRAYRLRPSPVALPSLAPLDADGLALLLPPAAPPQAPPLRSVPQQDREALARRVLTRWQAEVRDARGRPIASWPPLARELALFLDLPGYAGACSGATGPECVSDAVATRLEGLLSRLEGGRR